ncbi:MAG: hypothetical protein GY711_29180 [bacterium]|nr:hypothetical protein [bacterium]
MTSLYTRLLLLASAGTVAATSASAQILTDDFEVDSSASYTVVNDGTPDGTQTFAFDYVAAGLPLAPRSASGDTNGLRLTANDTAGMTDVWTLFHNTPVNAARYRLTVDMWMNFDALSGSTEFAHIGVGGDGATFNSVFTPISGTGAFISVTGDGGSISDYRWFRDAANTPLNDSDSTTLPNDHPSYLGHGSNASGAYYQALFPSPPATIAGSPGNIWTTVTIDVDNIAGVITFRFDGSLTFRGRYSGTFDGFASLGINDVFTSVSGASNLFIIYDNLDVSETPPDFIGSSYCGPAVANSTGMSGVISAAGTTSVADNDVYLIAEQLPAGQFGYFLAGQTQGSATPMGSQGVICLMGNIGRYNQPIEIIQGPSAGLPLDLDSVPVNPPVAVIAGDTWNFQCWYRDSNPGNTSNFTDGVTIVFL